MSYHCFWNRDKKKCMKKVLVISYYWPPAGSVSVLRTLKIVKYLRNFGWEPIVYVPENANYDYIDKNNEKDIPENITILRGKIIEPFGLFRKLSGRIQSEPLDNILRVQNKKLSLVDQLGAWIRGNFFIPDARSLWIAPSVGYLKKHLESNPVDAIFTDGPPHTNTMIGYHLSKDLNIPWLADFQDPWTQVDYLQDFPLTKWAWRKHRNLEQLVLKQASKITIASPSWKTDLESIGAKNVDVVYYGYDEEDFKGITKNKNDNKFVIFHGGLLGFDRFPEMFFESLITRCLKDSEFLNRLKIILAGKVDFRIVNYVKNSILADRTDFKGFLPRKEVIQFALDADLLLLPLNKSKNSKGRLPGKLYEYLNTGNPILAFGPENSDASKILIQTKRGVCIEYESDIKIDDYVNTKLNKNEDEIPKALIQGFSNLEQTRFVADLLNKIIIN